MSRYAPRTTISKRDLAALREVFNEARAGMGNLHPDDCESERKRLTRLENRVVSAFTGRAVVRVR